MRQCRVLAPQLLRYQRAWRAPSPDVATLIAQSQRLVAAISDGRTEDAETLARARIEIAASVLTAIPPAAATAPSL